MLDWFANNLMQANPDKFQALAIGKKSFKEQICFDLNGSKIKCEEHVKLLGVTIDYELNFDKHISKICKKSARRFRGVSPKVHLSEGPLVRRFVSPKVR